MSLISIPWLKPDEPFPPVETALANGLLVAGADLTASRLLDAYSQGLFPWYNPGEPVLWWSPDPRTILQCNQFKLSKSLAKKCRQIARQELSELSSQKIAITTNMTFLQVIAHCSNIKRPQEGTWITNEIIQAYYHLHQKGHAHSIEVWRGKELVGGLYGVQIGQFFFGESMFSLMTDASKIALYYLTQYLQHHLDIQYIDCQQETPHLLSLGAHAICRKKFTRLLRQYTPLSTPAWHTGQLCSTGTIHPFSFV